MCTKAKQGRILRRAEHEAELEANRQQLRSAEGEALLRAHRQRAEGPWSYGKLYGGFARVGTRGLANAWKQALVQGMGWNLLLLVAHRTGWTPRGWSMREGAPAPARGGTGLLVCAWGLLLGLLSLLAGSGGWGDSGVGEYRRARGRASLGATAG